VQKQEGEEREDEHAGIFRALAEVLAERGGGTVSTADVAARAGISGAKLRARFADLESCFLAAFEWCSQRGGAAMREAYDGEHGWVEGVRSALAALLGLIEAEPDLARLWIVYALGAGPRVLRSRSRTIAALTEYIDHGRCEARVRSEPPALTAEGVVGAVLVVLQTRLLAPEQVRPSEWRGELMSLILLPYLGAAAARRELARPVRFRPRLQKRPAADVLDQGQRVT
jgi:AcrR family transcriptional regulator